jgi:hypothetical protein
MDFRFKQLDLLHRIPTPTDKVDICDLLSMVLCHVCATVALSIATVASDMSASSIISPHGDSAKCKILVHLEELSCRDKRSGVGDNLVRIENSLYVLTCMC